MGPPPFISKFNLVSESPVIQPPAPRGVVCILSTRHFYEKGKERQKIQKNALKQHFLGRGCLQVALSYECHYTPHRMPKTQNQWEPVETELLLVFYSFHYTLMWMLLSVTGPWLWITQDKAPKSLLFLMNLITFCIFPFFLFNLSLNCLDLLNHCILYPVFARLRLSHLSCIPFLQIRLLRACSL